ncbi:DUF4184 family protein [Roseateles sp. DAIF2]|uniref:metal-dependent hydrolase n=1 Tax=Roseateles sp. DAIF2 TaxID=2714952 RepID=UPI0018A3243F|nr:metal-dependent hydrolase [Roseateles sp. DAIF2]QPF72968.1 DUF4184 family protein [Roseateles sp. DAIF2]
MPITPFHFGLGAALHGAAPRRVSFRAFCVASVLIDLESLHKLLRQRHPVHAFLHSYLGATLVVLATLLLFLLLRRWATRLPNLLGWRDLKAGAVTLGAALGAYSHIVLDSIMHADMRPLWPFSQHNGLLGVLSLRQLHLWCLGLGALGLLLIAARRLLRPR